MKCPKCQQEMTKGEATVWGTVTGFFLVGMSHQHLWFKTPSGEKIRAVESNGTVIAFRCAGCRLVLVEESSTFEERMAAAGKRVGGLVRRIRNQGGRKGKAAQPGATDNPDGAQRLREDY